MGWGEEGGSGRGQFLSLGVVNIPNLSLLQCDGGWVGAGWGGCPVNFFKKTRKMPTEFTLKQNKN